MSIKAEVAQISPPLHSRIPRIRQAGHTGKQFFGDVRAHEFYVAGLPMIDRRPQSAAKASVMAAAINGFACGLF
ncbi:hypothetical protein [Bradyrhizobium japonicum]|uniref:hypothetical protein n=1 Tax=Bradyrhizobium japonicum TaxID=375 RepID=UPI00209E14DE|nr:hypothetical protein [Bradyrhizobium japonicum]MCP1761201.1 hypothetical protein [Bradyrhizobium japonicum]MCP1792781.1 hypothetical protein [Bradyrhizobium japonicum]MCP1805215.1 hypothetical protein [Bradyrhizobium japonicum]MCP1814233.1 hypothetical protein [Bradyrhizobium japonicum]MCP1874339.1 hypothetical protein [Bradyrhizobium japonicum]